MTAGRLEGSVRLVGVLLVAAGLVELSAFNDPQPAPFLIGATLAGLSFTHAFSLQWSVKVLSVLCLVLPLAAFAMFLRGRVMVGVPVFDALVFGWLWSRCRARLTADQTA